MAYRILAVNPGSTSTKVGCFEGERELFTVNVSHDAEKLKEFPTISSQLSYRKETILQALEDAHIDLQTMDAFVGRGGGLMAVEGAVVMNRVKSPSFPNSISEVIYQSGQFGPAVTGKLSRVMAAGKTTDSCYQAAQEAIAGNSPVGDAVYFGDGQNFGQLIGGHWFHS